LDGRPAARIGIVGLVALTVDPVELACLISIAMAVATAKYVGSAISSKFTFQEGHHNTTIFVGPIKQCRMA
jgi:hypothetical protein